jgi:hypothetical protein
MKNSRLASRTLRLLLAGIVLFQGINQVSAQAIPHVQRYSVFKNGQAFVYSIDSAKVENGKSHLTLPDDVLFGTLWIGSNTGTINSINSVPGDLSTTRKLENLREMLTYNTGKRVRLILAYQDPEEAVVGSVLNNVAVFKTKDRWITTGIDKIETIEFLDEPVLTVQEKGQLLEIQWDGKTSGYQLTSTVYMRNNLAWVPEYFIILGNNNSATISLRAKLVNDAEDIKNADINFVAGVPNFKYGSAIDPLSSQDNFNKLMMSLSGRADNIDYIPNILSNQLVSDRKIEEAPAPDGTTMFAEGEASEDFYYYTVKNVSLPKGGRATYPILDGNVTVKHIYSGTLEPNGGYYPMYKTGTQERQTTVYHSIELTNSTGQPWTTGSAFVVRDGSGQTEPMAQDLMPYTSAGGKGEVKITSSPEIHVTDTEEEKDREGNAKEVDKVTYDEITVEGKIDIQNNKSETVTVDLHRLITGTLVRSDEPWTFTKEVNVYNALNGQNQVTWEFPMKSGEKKTITYRYKILVANQ